ncbi:DUF4030 domain-containing protein [Cytobacillus sp. Sa5YUA1]|uniref:DUF4030 domain-containing protein n=1 Tax=Cytobacillus stercorigallinarum TaxID=2762240 RepID=A0ABR8QVC1_9BACI|nr:DUF4030 domain-containing protein [Cytobacillus stercorigallinarum]MBD7939443.1 DUF4030 domain-containing protein [Cytobacillus stercorigallinarum]
MRKQYEDDTEFDSSLKKLDSDFMWKTKQKQELKNRIMTDIEQLEFNVGNKTNESSFTNMISLTRKLAYVGIGLTLLFSLFIGSAFISPAMASIVAKVLPISITPNFSNGQHNPDLTSLLFELIEKEGYTVNYVGITPSPYTIEISLILEDTTLKQATDDLEPKVSNYLYENGYDKYELKVSEAVETPRDELGDETSSLYDKVNKIVKEVFASYGYAEEADYELAGINESWFSNIVTIDIPEHIQKSTEIIADIEKEIESQNLDVKDIEVNTFNLEYRQQDNRWAYIASDIYDAMAGKSTYQLTGVSYRVKNGHSYVSIKTDWDKPPSEEIIQEIELAIQEYLALPETKEQIQNDNYTIQFLLMNEKSFVKITN